MPLPLQRFRRDFGLAAGVAVPRSPRDSFTRVLFSIGPNGEYSLSATDGEQHILIGNPGCEPVGLFPAQRTLNILNNMDGDELTIDGGTISDGRDSYELQVAPPEAFPQVSGGFENARGYEVEAEPFSESLKTASSACSTDLTRPSTGGPCLDFTGPEEMTVPAMDSRRLVVTTVPVWCEGNPDEDVRPIIPRRAAKTLASVLKESSQCVFRFGLRGGVRFEIGNRIELTVQPLNGTFPNYKKVIAAASRGPSISLPAAELLSTVKAASLVTTEESRGIDVEITTTGISATASGADVGNATIRRDIALGGECAFRADHEYLIAGLRPVADCEIQLTHNAPDGAICMTHDGGWQFLLMPMQVE